MTTLPCNAAVARQMRAAIEAHIEGFTDAARAFFIQYSVFEREAGATQSKQRWYLNAIIRTHDEGIYEIDEMEFYKHTSVLCGSYKCNYDPFVARILCDARGHSTPVRIYAIDLYPGTMPRHFRGEITTRGGYCEWNWFEFSADAVSPNVATSSSNDVPVTTSPS